MAISDDDWECRVCGRKLRYGFTPHRSLIGTVCSGHPIRVKGEPDPEKFPDEEVTDGSESSPTS